ncbi:MAG: ribose-phosphate diphosphokinase [Halobacteriales archaeon]
MIVAGSASQVLAARVARETGRELVRVEYESFPDGERLVRVPGVSSDDNVAVVASTPTDAAYVELLQILDAVRDAAHIDLVLPYMGYSRQDDEFEDGEAVSARALGSALPHVGSVTTVNLHEKSVLEDWFDAPDRRDLDATSALAEALDLDSPLVVAPDEGARSLASNLSEHLGGDADHLVKERVSGDEVRVETRQLDVDGRDAVLVDDMIATGGTMSEAVGVLRDNGARSVYVACVHPVFARNAVLRLYSAGVERVVATDTLGTALSEVSVAPLLARRL